MNRLMRIAVLIAMFAQISPAFGAAAKSSGDLSKQRTPARIIPGSAGGELNCPYKMNKSHNAKSPSQRVAEVERYLHVGHDGPAKRTTGPAIK